MKQFLIYSALFTILTIHITFAQSNISANRVAVKDSLSLKGAWVNSINNDSTLKSASDKSISTDGALKKYILQALSDTGNINKLSLQSLFDIFSMQPHAMKVNTRFTYMPGITGQSFDFEFISSDSIVTTLTTRPDKTGWIYVFGKPPYTIKCKSVAADSGFFTYFNIYKRSEDGSPQSLLSHTYISRDSIKIEKTGVIEDNIWIYIGYSEMGSQDPAQFFYLNTKLVNLTNDVSVNFLGDIIYPGTSELIGQRIQPDQGIFRYYIYPAKAIKTINGAYSFYLPLTKSIELEIWANGQLSGITRVDPQQPNPEFSVTLPVSDLTIYVRDVTTK
ncbi:hypothetical protein [Chitinophaga sp. HK235]|uniref:hypothetical protein n=1 Tax=Chitinophaga sp. HK235 TaxID=2952571 RepID=UPI001BADE96F|nr:hypothetical protein [Chitinophaga sp. HK235]